ncbi:glutaredoxin [bacterium]|nr:glutaredoxin [bacterium]NDG31870.1 glutaredoxin [bacterium]
MIIYSKPNCPYCVAAKNLLKQHNIEYLEITVDQDISSEEYRQLFSWPTVPGIKADGVFIGGYLELVNYLVEDIIDG